MHLPDPVTLVREVVVRLVRPEERPKRDTLMDAHRYLGLKQFAGRGLRYVAEWNGEWLALQPAEAVPAVSQPLATVSSQFDNDENSSK